MAETFIDFFERSTMIQVIQDDIKNINIDNSIYIHPTTCFCDMNDSVGEIYKTNLFPFIDVCIRRRLQNEVETKTLLGRPYLPVGGAMLVHANDKKNQHVMCSPLMFTRGQDIHETRNIYHCFMACLCLAKRWYNDTIKKIYFPIIDIIGRPQTFVEQVYAAIVDFSFLLYIPKTEFNKMDFTMYIPHHVERDREQPEYCVNREIKELAGILRTFS